MLAKRLSEKYGKQLLNTKEVASEIGIAEVTLKKWIAEHRCPFHTIKMNKIRAIYVGDLGEWLEGIGRRRAKGRLRKSMSNSSTAD